MMPQCSAKQRRVRAKKIEHFSPF